MSLRRGDLVVPGAASNLSLICLIKNKVLNFDFARYPKKYPQTAGLVLDVGGHQWIDFLYMLPTKQ